jgi:hypothetical protein
MSLFGMNEGNSFLEIDGDEVRVQMGWGFRATIPRASIVEAHRRGYVWWAYGVHGWRGRWIVNGSGHNLASLRLEPPARAYVLGVPVRVTELWVSLVDPEGFLAAVGR